MENGPVFITQVTQLLAKMLKLSWKLYCAYIPQSSRQLERMNRTLKETLTKLKLETDKYWVNLLPFYLHALLQAWRTPYVKGLTPYEIMFGRPSSLLPKLGVDWLAELDNDSILKSLQALQMVLQQTHTLVRAT